ncbi:hypothetical protein JXJ21_20550 [candidate division KSB1 bacterium]|nr:hypothetical protein [candidate division KSB1 bacterium]
MQNKIRNTNPALSCPNASPINTFGDKPIGHPFDYLDNGFPWAAPRLKRAGMTKTDGLHLIQKPANVMLAFVF